MISLLNILWIKIYQSFERASKFCKGRKTNGKGKMKTKLQNLKHLDELGFTVVRWSFTKNRMTESIKGKNKVVCMLIAYFVQAVGKVYQLPKLQKKFFSNEQISYFARLFPYCNDTQSICPLCILLKHKCPLQVNGETI